MLAYCRGPPWNGYDFSACFERNYLQALFPLIACAISLLFLLPQLWIAARRKPETDRYAQLKQYIRTRNGQLGGAAVESDADEEEQDDEDEYTDEDEEQELVQRVRSKTTASVTTVDKPRGQIVISLVEEVAVLAVLFIQISALVLRLWGRFGAFAGGASIAVWSYIAILTSLRVFFSSTSRWSFSQLWYHTATLYGVQWIFAILVFRSMLIHPSSTVARALISTYFALSSMLFFIALASRKGNTSVELEYDGDLVPSREPLASVLSLATFTWVDPLVWKGYRSTFEMSDVWNLIPEDKAATILADYRQFKKVNALAWHLLRYFKRELIIQALWAALGAITMFVPTLLIMVILEYVQDPISTSPHAAWFYVILLFVAGVVNALANGQALWIGRRVCIRLRAIIIGEIFAKALRRRAAATSDKVLGGKSTNPDDEEAKESLVMKILNIGRQKEKKKKDAPKQADEQNAGEPVDDGQVSSGTIINLMAVDSFKIADACAYLHFLWAEAPVEFLMAIVLLYQVLGYSSLVGIGTMILLLPINMIIANRFSSIQKKILAATDARIHTTNEVLTNIRIIKYFAWEQRFMGSVDEKRVVELRELRNRYVIWSIAATIWSGTPIIITLLTFMVYTLVEKRDLVPSIAFTALSLFSLLRVPLDQTADMVAHVQESKVSADRLEEYLNEPETEKYNQLRKQDLDEDGEHIIGFEDGTFSWGGRDEDDFKMIDLIVRFKVGQMNVIIGPTGSGKTSMLMALLGEMTLLDGRVYLPGAISRERLKPDRETGLTDNVAYCSQQAWLINGTIKENIVFASDWDAKRYKNVIVACSLQRDLEILDAGDQTLVGEKGVTLSGGQKQRISLARALYCKARHVLMDDVLSAVDSHTAKWIFDKALLGPLMRNRTCILVTHNATLCLPYADFAVVLDNGRVAISGTATEVIHSGRLAEDASKFESRPASRAASIMPSRVPSDVGGEEAVEAVETATNGHLEHPIEAELLGPANGAPIGDPISKIISKDIPGMNKVTDNDIYNERKATGAVKIGIILKYLAYVGGPLYWLFAGTFFVLQQVSSVGTNLWIKQWSNAYEYSEKIGTLGVHHASSLTYVRGQSGSSFSCLRSGSCVWNFVAQPLEARVTVLGTDVDVGYYLGVYAVLGVAYMIITFVREFVLFAGSIRASSRIHRQLMESMCRAKFRFFDTTPLGQIMNRFSKDIESIDQDLAPVAVGVVHCLASIITIVVVISAVVPAFLIAGFFIAILYLLIGGFYISSSRDLKRLESVQRSPLYQQFGESLTGMTTIRAYGDERRFIRENLSKVNTHNRPYLYLWAANRWLSFRVDFVGGLVSFFAGAFVVLSVGRIDPGAAGMALTYAITFTENVLWFVRLYASNEQNMNAMERVKEYLDVEREAAQYIPENKPPANWPSQGAVEFIGYSTRYRSDFDLVLKHITFKILPGEKVGVVGRTGAGKSSLALALFRALEAEEGKILVDNVDIGLIGLQDLRENIVMVPQDPTLFTGTVRSNLDPFGLFTDEEIFTALRRVQLIGAPSATPSRPSTPQLPPSGSSQLPKSGSSTALVKKLAASKLGTSSPTDSTLPLENKNLFRNLSSPVAESGSNLSQGQRQLLCLARAMLKNPKVLMMDEATASIDYATDAKIQETIRDIKNTTITIAHRLQTIIDYDKVLVLDKGEVMEFGDPYDLIRESEGMFHSMCQMSGDYEVLLRDARRAWNAKRLVDDS